MDGVDLKPLKHLYTTTPSSTRSTSTINSSGKTSAFGEMNNIVARLLTNLTSSMRFEGSLNVDLNEITTNLVPFPRLHFLLSSMSPMFLRQSQQQVMNKRLNHTFFSDAFSSEYQLIRTYQTPPRSSVYLACGLFFRGNVEVSDINRHIQRLQSTELRMIHWNQEGFKIGVCSVPPIGQKYSLLCLSNNCCIRQTFDRIRIRFKKLYTRKAHVHHYTEYMETEKFEQALENANFLINEYAKLEASNGTQKMDTIDSKMSRIEPLF
jgi:tubulin epsilon